MVGIDFSFNYRKLTIASLYVQNGCAFICSNKDRNCGNGDRCPPAGGVIVKAIEVACGKEAIVIGKPSILAFDIIKEEHNLKSDLKYLMTGDNLETDIEFGHKNGMDTLLVLSGVTSAEML